MACQVAVKSQTRFQITPTTQFMNDQRQDHLIQPGIKRLANQLFWRTIADFSRKFGEQLTEFMRAFVIDPFHNSRISGILAPIRTGGAAP
jgi:hypothetical protein